MAESLYFKAPGVIKESLVTDDALKAAQSFVADKRQQIKASQLRKFYGDVKTLELRWKSASGTDRDKKEFAFAQILPLIKLLKAKSAYACKRRVVPQSFKDWIWLNVDNIHEYRDFEAFLLYFEAVVGFCYGEAKGEFN